MPVTQKFKAELERRGNGTLVELPFDVAEAFGQKRPPVKGTVMGYPFRTTIAVYGGRYFIGFNREIRAAAGIEVGDILSIELERDDAPRVVKLPDDLAAAFKKDKTAKKMFDGLSYTHQNEYARWINEAKRAATRSDRVTKSIRMLREGTKHP
jgi:Bacteriocin-protection, YdeI or OmpD-Associated/Domain of unknown function (DUF1905)